MCADRRSAAPHLAAARRRAEFGGSIVEIMVGIVVALLVGLIATGTALTFMKSQRQQMGIGGTASNLVSTMTLMKGDLSMAGLGFFNRNRYLCNTLQASQQNGGTTAILANGTAFVPYWITPQTNYDRIDIVYGTRVEAGAPVMLAATSDGTSALLKSWLPAAANDTVLLAPEDPNAAGASPCLLRTVTVNTPSAPMSAQRLDFGSTGIYNTGTFTKAPSLPDGSTVALLGAIVWHAYYVDANRQLIYEEPMAGRTAVLARNVIAFRAQYGAAPDPASGAPQVGTLASWEAPSGTFAAPLSPAAFARVRALRVGLIVRDTTKDKPPSNAPACDTTTTKPTLFGNASAENLTNADWACWRYRQLEAVVPMRNPVMGLGLQNPL